MISEIISLAELIRGLAQRKSELDKEYFENFIIPIWDSFSTIHKDYKESFTKYYNLVSQKDMSAKIIDEILEALNRDSALTSDLRSELSSLLRNLPPITMKSKEALLVEFINAIMNYFQYNDDRKQDDLLNTRIHIMHTIKTMSKHSKVDSFTRNELIMILDTSIKYIQLHYSRVAEAYYQLRNNLLA